MVSSEISILHRNLLMYWHNGSNFFVSDSVLPQVGNSFGTCHRVTFSAFQAVIASRAGNAAVAVVGSRSAAGAPAGRRTSPRSWPNDGDWRPEQRRWLENCAQLFGPGTRDDQGMTPGDDQGTPGCVGRWVNEPLCYVVKTSLQ